MLPAWLDKPAVYLFVIGGLAALSTVPFIVSDADRWDLNGHIQEAELQADMLPVLSYWNGYHGLGYEPYSSYSLLPRLVTGAFSKLIGVETAVKAFLVIAWVSTPYALHRFFAVGASTGMVRLWTTVTFCSLYFLPSSLGYSYQAAFYVGNYASTLGFPLLLLSVASLMQRRYRRAGVLSALTVLTHALSGVLLVGVLLCFVVYDADAWVALAGFGLSGFWLVPFVFRSGHYEVLTFVDHFATGMLTLILGLGAYAWYAWRGETVIWQRALFLAGLGITAITMYGLVDVEAWQRVPMHFHRLFIPAALFVLAALSPFISGVSTSMTRYAVAGVLVVTIVLTYPILGGAVYERASGEALPSVGQRVMFDQTVGPSLGWHSLPYSYMRGEKSVLPPLFVEAAPTATPVFVLQQAVQNGPVPSWGVERYDLTESSRAAILADRGTVLDMLGVDTVVELRCSAVKPSCVDVDRRNASLVSTHLDIRRGSSTSDAAEWMVAENKSVQVNAPVPEGEGTASLAGHSKAYNEVNVTVDAQNRTPIFVSMAHSDAWSVERGNASVQPAEPFGMVVFAEDDFTLTYTSVRWVHGVGLALSLVSSLVLCYPGHVARRGLLND